MTNQATEHDVSEQFEPETTEVEAQAEETPVTEAIELSEEVDRMQIGHLPIVVNGCWPELPGLAKSPAMAARSHKLKLSADAKRVLESASSFGRARQEQQEEQIDRLRTAVDPAGPWWRSGT